MHEVSGVCSPALQKRKKKRDLRNSVGVEGEVGGKEEETET
jgi:hypothetical protein